MAKGAHAKPRGPGRPQPDADAAQFPANGWARGAARRPRGMPVPDPADPQDDLPAEAEDDLPAERFADRTEFGYDEIPHDGAYGEAYGEAYDEAYDGGSRDEERPARTEYASSLYVVDGYGRRGAAGDYDDDDARSRRHPGGDGDGRRGLSAITGAFFGSRRSQPTGRRRARKPGSLLRELPILVGIAVILALLIKTLLVQAFYIPSDSMENTLLRGDRVLVNKLGARFGDPDRGEVVVFRDPGGWLSNGQVPQPSNPIIRGIKKTLVFIGLLPSDSQQDLIKRVIGLPGDRVVCCDDQGRVTVNGVPLDEPYVFSGNPPSDTTFDVTVPPGRLWVMGDHRSVSADSRVHLGEPGQGTIPMDSVVGRAFVIVWPLGRAGRLGVPDTFDGDRLDQARGAEPVAMALASAAAVPPLAWGFAGAFPIVALRRRRRTRRIARVGIGS